jgi:hypothetical protein
MSNALILSVRDPTVVVLGSERGTEKTEPLSIDESDSPESKRPEPLREPLDAELI